jgi:hypothetical protein
MNRIACGSAEATYGRCLGLERRGCGRRPSIGRAVIPKGVRCGGTSPRVRVPLSLSRRATSAAGAQAAEPRIVAMRLRTTAASSLRGLLWPLSSAIGTANAICITATRPVR